MNYRQLILKSESYLRQHPGYITANFSLQIFTTGGLWMADKLQALSNEATVAPIAINFNWYGYLKYSLCIAVSFFSACLFFKYNIFLLPLSLLIFYFLEVHFLFLFPLLIDNIKNPIYTSIKTTYKIGILKCMLVVMPISFFMLKGLLQIKSPFKNWHTGSMAILIWYQDEIRNRL